MEPRHLKTPDAELVLVRFTELDGHGLAQYRLWRMPAGVSAGAGPTIANFAAPSDDLAEQLVDAWYGGRRLMGNSRTLSWQRTLAAVEEVKKAAYHEALKSGNREAARVALEEYHEAAHQAEFLQKAFFAQWPGLS